jgi:dephospho-CoA kinase
MNASTSAMVVAMTGGVAAGKTAVTRRFEALGVPVHDADIAARAVVEPGSPGLAAIVAAFGPDSLDQNGQLNRAAMRQRVFSDIGARKRLESITHPLIRQWLRDRAQADTAPYCLLAIPLLAENITHYGWVDRILLVDASEATQIRRLMLRDHIDEALARNMLAHQASRAERLAIADDVIENNGDESELDIAVTDLHRRYLALANQHARG